MIPVTRVVSVIQADPNKERVDRVVTRWIKRHLSRLGAGVNLEKLNSLIEDKDMLSENLENLVKKERLQGKQIGMQQGVQRGRAEGRIEGRMEGVRETACNLIALNLLTDAQIAQVSGLSETEVAALRAESKH